MALLMPGRLACVARMAAGERRFAERLESRLDEQHLCWYDLPLGAKRVRPDFLILHPERGMLVLEVRDWPLDSVREISRQEVSRLTEDGFRRERNPMLLARICALELALQLEREPSLRQLGPRGIGRLGLAYGWGLVLPQITRWEFEICALSEVLESERVLCRDEMEDDLSGESFSSALWGLLGAQAGMSLGPGQIDKLRWQFFPELRVHPAPRHYGLSPLPEGFATRDEGPSVLDLAQERGLRLMLEVPTIIGGASGSGKTSLLVAGARQYARLREGPVLLLTHGAALAARLRLLFEGQDGDGITVRDYAAWCAECLAEAEIGAAGDLATLTQAMEQALQAGRMSGERYAAVLVDEAQEFTVAALRLLTRMVDTLRNRLVLAHDDSQSLHARLPPPRFGFGEAGWIGAPLQDLDGDHRRSRQLALLLHRFVAVFAPLRLEREGVAMPPATLPLRSGPWPELRQAPSFEAEADAIAERITRELAAGRSAADIAVLYRRCGWIGALERALQRRGVECRSEDAVDRLEDLYLGAPAVLLLDIARCGGLEFDCVFIPGLGDMPDPQEPLDLEMRRLYVAMCRARELLVMSYQYRSEFVQRVNGVLQEIRLVNRP